MDIPQFWLGDIRSHDVFRPIVRKRQRLMDYNLGYPPILLGDIRSRDMFRPIVRKQKDLIDYNPQYFFYMSMYKLSTFKSDYAINV